MTFARILTFTLAACAWAVAGSGGAQTLVEPPSLAAQVQSGRLPPMGERLPANPRIVKLADYKTPGKYGGDLTTLIGSAGDLRLINVYGYTRLVTYDEKTFELVPDLLEDVVNEDDRVFTFKLRKGHRWSDGHPFTAEDFRYYWEDMALNKDVSPSGPPKTLLADDNPGTFEVLDEYTVRYSWTKPNPFFLPAIAATTPLFVYRPAHYLKQFHVKYADRDKLRKAVLDDGQRNWVAVHFRRDRQYRSDNPDLPTLDPWRIVTRPPANRFIAERNPFFHRVDEHGRQLPYINRLILVQANSKLIAAKAGSGESDLQSRNLFFNNYTFLKNNEKRANYNVYLWREAKGSHFALFPNLNASDPVWRKLNRDVRYRRALSLAIDRTLINRVLYFGLAVEGNNTVLKESPLYRDEYRTKWARHDIREANRLLDEIGLKRRGDGLRELPDGRMMDIIVETAGEESEQSDVLELIRETWIDVGIRLFTRPLQREVFRNRIFAGETVMSVWSGLENGVATADMSPAELAPTQQIHLQWPKWGQHYETSGQAGEAPDMPAAHTLMAFNESWIKGGSRSLREKMWHEMLALHADQVFTIGVVTGVRQPVIARATLRNVPKEALYNWEPGAQFGIYQPDTFWFATE
ncbi:MAG: ABC transporter substrate-binding protein [Alphaproteobacteria bacterium]|nr:ABC transporter substrate-binding protein [Alphaproteobacteria bacterium]